MKYKTVVITVVITAVAIILAVNPAEIERSSKKTNNILEAK